MIRRVVGLILVVVLAVAGPFSYVIAQDTGPYREIMTLGRGAVRSVAWSPDGQVIAVGGALGIWLYTPELEDIGLLIGHTKAVYGLAFSPDGTRLVSASHDLTVRIWDLETQGEIYTLEGHTDLVVAVDWSPRGDLVASGSYDGTVRLWNPDTGEAIRALEGHTGWVNQVAFSPDGSQVISNSYDGTIRLWEASAGALLDTRPGTPEQWEQSTGQREDTFLRARAHPIARSLSPDGAKQAFASWDGAVWVSDAAAGNVLLAEQPEHMDWIIALAWSDDGSAVIDVTLDGRAHLWDVESGDLIEVTTGRSVAPTTSADSPDGSRRAEIDGGGAVRILDAASGDVITELPGQANAVGWSPDGTRLAVALRNGTIAIWSEQ
jgi:WD40 repeat protein